MDRTVLLVLLCLQVFLLITTFTSTDAAALLRGSQLSSDPRGNDHSPLGYRLGRALSNCSWRPGACSLAALKPKRTPPPPPPPSPPPDQKEDQADIWIHRVIDR